MFASALLTSLALSRSPQKMSCSSSSKSLYQCKHSDVGLRSAHREGFMQRYGLHTAKQRIIRDALFNHIPLYARRFRSG